MTTKPEPTAEDSAPQPLLKDEPTFLQWLLRCSNIPDVRRDVMPGGTVVVWTFYWALPRRLKLIVNRSMETGVESYFESQLATTGMFSHWGDPLPVDESEFRRMLKFAAAYSPHKDPLPAVIKQLPLPTPRKKESPPSLPKNGPPGLKEGDEIEYLVTWPRGEPEWEKRTGVVEGKDGDYHAPEGTYGRGDTYRHNGRYLVRRTSCKHHAIDSVSPDQILSWTRDGKRTELK